MATLALDFSGLTGLVYNESNIYEGSDSYNYRDVEDMFVEGIYNPVRQFGFLAPSNSTISTISGADDEIVAAPFDYITGDTFMFETEGDVLQLTSPTDTSASALFSLTDPAEFRDAVIYEVGGKKALVYLVDSMETAVEGSGIAESGGMYVGYYTIDQDDGTEILDKTVNGLTSGVNLVTYGVTAVSDQNHGTKKYRKLAFEITSSDTGSFSSSSARYLSGVSLWLGRTGTATATIQVSLQGDASASTSPYTARGAWTTATTYAVNDTVTNGGETYQCFLAHTSGASTQPGVGGSWESNWSVFGAPDGTVLVSDTITFDSIEDAISQSGTRYKFSWEPVNLTASKYWIVIEETTTGLGASDELTVLGTINATGIYDGNDIKAFFDDTTDYWRSADPNGDYGLDNISFILHLNRRDNWTQNMIYGRFNEDTGQDGFLHVSDSGLLYWVCGNKIHTLDGSLTGGAFGRATEGVLVFPSYMQPVDIAETRSRMYIAIQPIQDKVIDETYMSDKIGVFIWDRRSNAFGATDFYTCPGATKIHALFRSINGNIMAITSGSGDAVEVRGIEGSAYVVKKRLNPRAYPRKRRGISYVDGMVNWIGQDKILYAYGSPAPGYPEAVYKILEITTSSSEFYGGVMFSSNTFEGTERVKFTYSLATTDAVTSALWFPHLQNLGTTHAGNVKTGVKYLAPLSTVGNLIMYCIPTGTGSSTIATVNFYFNNSSSVGMAKTVTLDMASRGYVSFDLNKHNVNAIQFEIVWASTEPGLTESFFPSLGVLTYEPTKTHTPSKD